MTCAKLCNKCHRNGSGTCSLTTDSVRLRLPSVEGNDSQAFLILELDVVIGSENKIKVAKFTVLQIIPYLFPMIRGCSEDAHASHLQDGATVLAL